MVSNVNRNQPETVSPIGSQIPLSYFLRSTEEAPDKLSWKYWRELIAFMLASRVQDRETQASLFNYIKQKDDRPTTGEVEISGEILARLAKRSKGLEPTLIHSLFADPAEEEEEIRQSRSRRLYTALTSIGIHALTVIFIILVAIFSRLSGQSQSKKPDQQVVMLTPLLPALFNEGDSRSGGGGGGGGKRELPPPSGGRLPKIRLVQLVPPDPKPIERPQETFMAEQSVTLPIDIPQNQALPIGDITQPPAPDSSGPGSGGGIGVGSGTGIGPGRGSGVGPGSGAGFGGGSGPGVGPGTGPGIYSAGMSGLRNPEAIYQPLPPYTEDARKNKIEGAVVLQVLIRRDGSIDNPQILRSLGYGLDESAVKTVVTQWKFRPGILKGQPVDVLATIEVFFRLL